MRLLSPGNSIHLCIYLYRADVHRRRAHISGRRGPTLSTGSSGSDPVLEYSETEEDELADDIIQRSLFSPQSTSNSRRLSQVAPLRELIGLLDADGPAQPRDGAEYLQLLFFHIALNRVDSP